MGYYLSVDQVKAAFAAQVSAVYDVDGAISDARITADIEEAEGVVHSYVRQRYAVPVSGADAGLLRKLTLDLLRAQALRRLPGELPESVGKAEDKALALLRDIATGKATLGAATTPTEAPQAADAIIVEGNTPQMTRARLDQF